MAVDQNLSSKIADIPPGAEKSLKRGFSILTRFNTNQIYDFTDKVIAASLAGRSFVDLEDFATDFGLGLSEARNVTNAVSSVVGLMSESNVNIEEFLEIASGKLYDPDQKDIVRNLARLTLEKRNDIKNSLTLASLASETLPSLRAFSLTVDLRPKFEGGSIVNAVSIALLHLDTDAEPEIWVQLTKSDIKYIQHALSNASDQMEKAEALFKNKDI